MSHSWSDDGEAKFNQLQEYVTGLEVEGKGAVQIWLDKAWYA